MPDTYGKLIRNGVNFSHDSAESISYDNTTSELQSTNAQDALDEINAAISSGVGGHTIIDNSGTSMTDRAGLQFPGAYVTDDSTNNRTVVSAVRSMTEAQRAALPAAQQQGFIYTTDTPNNYPLTGAIVDYRNDKTVNKAIDELSTGAGNVRVMTDEEYENLDPEDRYGIIITDIDNPNPMSIDATDVTYRNSDSQLVATTLQAALDELNAKLDNYINSL